MTDRSTPAAPGFTVERPLDLPGRRVAQPVETEPDSPMASSTRIPRLARLLALAHRMQQLVDSGEVATYSDLASVGGVTTARMTQIMNLLRLAPSIQEAILIDATCSLSERQALTIANMPTWKEQVSNFAPRRE